MMSWIEEKGIFCSVGTGFGKRISLKAVHKYPSAEFWAEPDDACIIYQKSEGRGKIMTVCYSNLYPEEYEDVIVDGINLTLNKMKLITGQEYPLGMNEKKPKIDVELFAERMSASCMFKLDRYEQGITELRNIANANPAMLSAKKKRMSGMMQAVQKERRDMSAHKQIQKEFNRSASAREIEITGAGSFVAKNSYGVDITDFVAIAEKRKTEQTKLISF